MRTTTYSNPQFTGVYRMEYRWNGAPNPEIEKDNSLVAYAAERHMKQNGQIRDGQTYHPVRPYGEQLRKGLENVNPRAIFMVDDAEGDDFTHYGKKFGEAHAQIRRAEFEAKGYVNGEYALPAGKNPNIPISNELFERAMAPDNPPMVVELEATQDGLGFNVLRVFRQAKTRTRS